MNFIGMLAGVILYSFLLLVVFVGMGVFLGGDEGGFVGFFLAIITAATSGYVAEPMLAKIVMR